MSKVIVERPRRGGFDGPGARKGRIVDQDLMVSKQGMRAPHVRNYGGKELNENLAPLRRFIRSRVGQRWDDVYSEISQHLRVDSAVQQHVRDHVEDFVSVRTRMIDGEIWTTGRFGHPTPVKGAWMEFYVDPRDGILRENPHRKSINAMHRERRAAENAKLMESSRSLPGGIELRKADGIWYQVELKPIPTPVKKSYTTADGKVQTYEISGRAYDVILRKTVEYPKYRHHAHIYCSSKRQLSSAELRRYGVQNG